MTYQGTVISISNHKGGVGKTTSVVNIGAGLANLNKKTLVIDLDPQANLSQCLGINDESAKNIYGALRGDYNLPIYNITTNLDLVPSHLDLASIEIELSTKIARETVLKKLIEPVISKYDYIIIDCPPSLGLITINAFVASKKIYIPLQAQFLALHGLNKLTDIVKLVQESLNPILKIEGVFITHYDNRKILNRDIVDSVKNYFSGKVFKSMIRDNVSLAEAPVQGIDIFRYNPVSNGAKDYESLVLEIINQ